LSENGGPARLVNVSIDPSLGGPENL